MTSTNKNKWRTVRPLPLFELLLKRSAAKYDFNIFGLPLPKKAFNIIRLLPEERLKDGTVRKAFESKEKAQKEDKLRRQSLLKSKDRYAHLLAELLERNEGMDKPYPTMASAVYCRHLRIRLLGEILRRVAPYRDAQLRFVTLINSKWRVPAGSLDQYTAETVMESFRQHLNRSGTTGSNGFLFAWLHGEYDPSSRCFRLHIHALVRGEKIESLRSLKGQWGYETIDGEIKRPIAFYKIKNRPRQVSYCAQPYWPSRPRYIDQDSRKYWKDGSRTRIPEPHHTEMLIWLHQQAPKHFFLSQPNLRVATKRKANSHSCTKWEPKTGQLV